MRSKLLVITLMTLFTFTSNAQTISEHHFKYSGNCILQNVLNTEDGKRNKVSVYQCTTQSTSTTIYRIIITEFKESISDVNEYVQKLKSEYTKLGVTTSTTLKGVKAVKVIERVDIQGYSMKQISIATLYKNKSITLVLVSNSPDYETLLIDFQSKFSLL